jgi:hypothetical protein
VKLSAARFMPSRPNFWAPSKPLTIFCPIENFALGPQRRGSEVYMHCSKDARRICTAHESNYGLASRHFTE